MVILLNCITLGMYQPCVDDQCVTNRCKILQVRTHILQQLVEKKRLKKRNQNNPCYRIWIWGSVAYRVLSKSHFHKNGFFRDLEYRICTFACQEKKVCYRNRIFTIQLSQFTKNIRVKAAIIRCDDKQINRLRILTRFPAGSQLV